ncbi:DEAD/DEAH box helicase [Paenibacillus koleovorans]|uniref:DEAD/DEAH box helicase n=1 Tax=Paenibacillus koleovorans TaxID=121608 RepID=UPI001FE51D73|nr:DEAD/DEAH box helicase [Paenibacillus koleovorans]
MPQPVQEPMAGIEHPVVRGWFLEKFGRPTDVQRRAWPAIQDGAAVLIAAPTGSGKTLSAILPCLDRIAVQKLDALAEEGKRRKGVKLLYITPLKALNNDIHHHLFGFLAEMDAYAAHRQLDWSGISVGIRTGDTTQSTRASMIKHPPDVLVTTPESLYLLLASEKAREMLRTVERIIVDEIHQVAADKRGLHMSVSLERLAEWCGREPQRIGVSATIRPLPRVGAFLAGYDEAGKQREMVIVESPMDKRFDLTVTMPDSYKRRSKTDDTAAWTPLVELLLHKMEGSRSVLVFVNNRRLCERLTLWLNDYAGYEMARSHHGSVSREKRLDVERALKAGELRCLVATASLELGIDVGHIDLVVQIDSPQSAAAGIQRIGRAGHSVGDVSRGVIVAREPGALAECALLARDIAARAIEDIRIPEGDWDVLAQQLAAMSAAGPVAAERAYALLRRSYGFRSLTRKRMTGALQVLSGYYPFCKPVLDWEREDNPSHAADTMLGALQPRANTKMAVLLGAGTIPQSSAYPVYHQDSRIQLGELDEEFVHESRVGDVFQLGTSSWRIQSIQNDRITVSETANAYSEIPFWRGEGAGRSYDTSLRLGAMQRELLEMLNEGEDVAEAWLASSFKLEPDAAERVAALVARQRDACAVPTDRHIVIEQYKDDVQHVHLVIHSLQGKRVNRTWQLVLQRAFEQALPYRFFTYAKENGIEFVFPQWDSSWMELLRGVTADRVESLLRESLGASPLLGVTFRRLAETSLLLARSYTRMPQWVKRLRSEALLREALPFADQFPLIREAMDVCLETMMDAPHLMRTLRGIEDGTIRVSVFQNAAPSPYAIQFMSEFAGQQIYESEAFSKDIQLQLLSVSREAAVRTFGAETVQQLVGALLNESGEMDWDAANGSSSQRHAAADGAEDLYRLLKQRGDATTDELERWTAPNDEQPEPSIRHLLMQLKHHNRVTSIRIAGEERWICADELVTYRSFPAEPQSITFILRRYVDRQLYVTMNQLRTRYELDRTHVQQLFEEWAAQGELEPSPFADPSESESANDADRLWTSRHASEQIIRLSASRIRKNAEPVEPQRLCERMLELQLVQPRAEERGADGLRLVIEKLQGVFLPMTHWESIVFPTRLPDYRKEWLDQLCAMGEVLWIGHRGEGEKEGRVSFFLTNEEAKPLYRPLLQAKQNRPEPGEDRHHALLELLRSRGASFLTALSREIGAVPSELLAQLVELAWEGYVSNDQFAPIRMHGQAPAGGSRSSKPPSRSAGRGAAFQSGLGRWYLLESLASEPQHQAANSSLSTKRSESTVSVWMQHLIDSNGLFTRGMLAERLNMATEQLDEPIRQLESWGLLTRGLWVKGLQELQFSTPPQIEALRRNMRIDKGQTNNLVLSAVDPANPYGSLIPWPEAMAGPAFARKSGNFLVLRDGRLSLWIENNGRRFYSLPGLSEDPLTPLVLASIIRTLYRLSGVRKLVIDSWNGVPVANSDLQEPLKQLGAERDRNSAVIWLSSVSSSAFAKP